MTERKAQCESREKEKRNKVLFERQRACMVVLASAEKK